MTHKIPKFKIPSSYVDEEEVLKVIVMDDLTDVLATEVKRGTYGKKKKKKSKKKNKQMRNDIVYEATHKVDDFSISPLVDLICMKPKGVMFMESMPCIIDNVGALFM